MKVFTIANKTSKPKTLRLATAQPKLVTMLRSVTETKGKHCYDVRKGVIL